MYQLNSPRYTEAFIAASCEGSYSMAIKGVIAWNIWDDLACGPCERQSALVVAAFGNFIDA
jgi:hypothetical protein